MSWAKLDDQFPDHPKVAAAGPAAGWLFVCGLCYCSRYLTDGFIPAGQLRKLADIDGAAQTAEVLCRVGLWDAVPGGYQIHDYLDYNPCRDQVLAERNAAKNRMQNIRSGERRSNHNGSSAEVPANIARSSPSPVPVPESPTPSPTPAAALTQAPTPVREAAAPVAEPCAAAPPDGAVRVLLQAGWTTQEVTEATAEVVSRPGFTSVTNWADYLRPVLEDRRRKREARPANGPVTIPVTSPSDSVLAQALARSQRLREART